MTEISKKEVTKERIFENIKKACETINLVEEAKEKAKDSCLHFGPSTYGKGTLLRQPIMYFYNFTGLNQQVTIDFNNLKIVESYPEVRVDNKAIFTVDQDGYVDGKFDYFYYEILLEKNLLRPDLVLYFSNDKGLLSSLTNLGTRIGLYPDEINHFAQVTNFELKKLDTKYFKVEVFGEERLNSELPITVYPEPDYFLRRYVKFTPSATINKTNAKFGKSTLRSLPRSGSFRIAEWGYFLDNRKVK